MSIAQESEFPTDLQVIMNHFKNVSDKSETGKICNIDTSKDCMTHNNHHIFGKYISLKWSGIFFKTVWLVKKKNPPEDELLEFSNVLASEG